MSHYRNILCATDFSDQCRIAAERAAELARRFGAQLTLLHVVEHFPVDRSNTDISPEDVDPVLYHEEKALGALAEIAGRLKLDQVKQAVRFSMDSAQYEILRYIAEHRTDLLVIAAHGRHGIASFPGSTLLGATDKSPCDVMIVHCESQLKAA